MYHHVKKLMYTVTIGEADPRFGKMLLEQFGGANGELAAAMQYSIQGLNCDDPGLKDLLMDIGTEELSHLEVIGTLARMHLKPTKSSREAADADPLIAICGGGGVSLYNSVGNAWTADYLKITGELDVDLRSNIAAEARAKIVYERLIDFCDDSGSKDALQFLMTREITHMKAFMTALAAMEKPPLTIGLIKPSPKIVDQYFNTSTGMGDQGEQDLLAPWNDDSTSSVLMRPLSRNSLIRHSARGVPNPSRGPICHHRRRRPRSRCRWNMPVTGRSAKEAARRTNRRNSIHSWLSRPPHSGEQYPPSGVTP
jgi:manganese catalase